MSAVQCVFVSVHIRLPSHVVENANSLRACRCSFVVLPYPATNTSRAIPGFYLAVKLTYNIGYNARVACLTMGAGRRQGFRQDDIF